ncbi:helix-turn-helix transcriptional regulator [Pacificibacter sp. AS14]|uniref:helix-turn-helix domain-containing protein n=1 Tax=Pacificibacter sp. AS14 TaxID=3135785 RepID=UPI00316E5051
MPDKTHDKLSNASRQRTDPMQLRAIFGSNLRALSAGAPSVARLCRDLGINRTQFNRYLGGEAFPRPDVLDHICRFFGVDARILLEPIKMISDETKQDFGLVPLDQIGKDRSDQARAVPAIDYARMPLGACLLYRRSFLNNELLSVSMASSVVRSDGKMVLTVIMPRDLAQALGLSLKLKDRRCIGEIYQHPTGISFALQDASSGISHFAFMEYSYLSNSNLYAGECLSTIRLGRPGRITDLILLERLTPTRAAMLAARHQTGYKCITDMKPVVQGYFTQTDV